MLPLARRQLIREEMVTLNTGKVSNARPPNGFQSMSKDIKVLELEIVVFYL